MITRPSIEDLLGGLVANLEKAQASTASGAADLVVPMLTVLDRVRGEWSTWLKLLDADNLDMLRTLESIGCEPPNPEAPSYPDRTEAHNRELKQAVVDAIERFDLPAEAGASAERKAVDQVVLALLLRILRREDEVPVPLPRSSPTSGNAASTSLSLDELARVLRSFLVTQLPNAVGLEIIDLQRIAGGASREAWIFDLRWSEEGRARFEPCILMREPLASVLVSDSSNDTIDGTRRTVATEVRLIRAMKAAGLPVPDILWADGEGRWLQRPFSIARRLPGTSDLSQVLGTPAEAPILAQFVDLLGDLHDLDPEAAGVGFLGRPKVHTTALAQVGQFEHNFRQQRLEPFPAAEYLIRWLKKHAPVAGRVCVVHGDYRLGNFLVDQGRIIAILDWEQVHVGDPLEEIAFMYWALWTMDPVCPIEEFVRRYETRTGRSVDRDALAWYRVFIELKMLVVLLTGLKSYYATPERQLHYGGGLTTDMIRGTQLRVLEALRRGGPTVAFDAYRKHN